MRIDLVIKRPDAVHPQSESSAQGRRLHKAAPQSSGSSFLSNTLPPSNLSIIDLNDSRPKSPTEINDNAPSVESFPATDEGVETARSLSNSCSEAVSETSSESSLLSEDKERERVYRLLEDREHIAFLLLGMTGAGKTTFINEASKGIRLREIEISNGLESQTTKVLDYVVPHGDRYAVHLIDTPGFNDTRIGNFRVLGKISSYLKETYSRGMLLSGVIYIHDITGPRMGEIAEKCLEMVHELCGSSFMETTLIVTAKWSTQQEGHDYGCQLDRERELCSEPRYWKRLIREGAETCRFLRTPESAAEIIDKLVRKAEKKGWRMEPLKIQTELEKGENLVDTSAGTVFVQSRLKDEEDLKTIVEDLKKRPDTLPNQWEAEQVEDALEDVQKETFECEEVQREMTDSYANCRKAEKSNWKAYALTGAGIGMVVLSCAWYFLDPRSSEKIRKAGTKLLEVARGLEKMRALSENQKSTMQLGLALGSGVAALTVETQRRRNESEYRRESLQ